MNLLDVFVKVVLDDQVSNKIGGVTRAIGKGLSTAAKVGAAGVAAASTAVVKLTKDAINGYAEFEQLAGGIETLFGAGGKSLEQYALEANKTIDAVVDEYNVLIKAQNKVMENAKNAWKNQTMSANQYMETSISLSGALLKSLDDDQEKAAELVDMVISDIADISNKYGYLSEETTNVYKALSKGNYMTLDNLFGGMFKGSKEGLREMLQYAMDYRKTLGETVTYSEDSYADIVTALHDVSLATGVYGTTQFEALTTIQGSLNSMKAAWSNLVTGLADDTSDFDSLISNLVESVGTAWTNIEPRVEKSLLGIADLITNIMPSAVDSLVSIIPDLLPKIIEAAVNIVKSLATGIMKGIPKLIPVATNLVRSLITFMAEHVGESIDGIMQVILMLTQALIDNAQILGRAAGELIGSLVVALIENIPQLVVAAGEIAGAVFVALLSAGVQMGQSAVEWINQMHMKISERIGEFVNVAAEIVSSFLEGIGQKIEEIAAKGREIVTTVKNAVVEKASEMVDAGFRLVQGLWNGIAGNLAWIKGKIAGWVGDVTAFMKNLFGIASPSKVTAEMGMWLVKGLAKGITDNTAIVDDAWTKMSSGITDVSAEYTASGNNTQSRSGAINIVQNIQSVAQTPVDLANATAAYFEQARWAMA